MSLDYAEKLKKEKKVDMRKWCQRPGTKDEEGNNVYMTQQHHKAECDVNNIIRKYDRTGIIGHVQQIEARFGDATGADFRKAQDLFLNSQKMFDALPANIRKRFQNNAGDFLEFMENPDNREEAIQLGLIKQDSKPSKDGLGEHVTADDYKDAEEVKKAVKKQAKSA